MDPWTSSASTRRPTSSAGCSSGGSFEADGIEVLEQGEASGPYRVGPVILFVRDEHAGRADELIRASGSGELALEPDEGAAETASIEDRSD